MIKEISSKETGKIVATGALDGLGRLFSRISQRMIALIIYIVNNLI